jgi:hypothetical protein
MATWSLFCFFKSPEPLIQPMPLSERPRTNTENDVHSVLRYDAEIDYTLPSYSELPSPPAYQKITIPDNAVTVDNRHIPTLELATTPNAESSSISRSNYDNSNSEIDQNTNNQQQYNESNEASLTSTADSVVLSKSDDNNKLAAGSSYCTLTALAESSSADIRKD